MSPQPPEAIPVAIPLPDGEVPPAEAARPSPTDRLRYEQAALVLEKAAGTDPNVLYLLALAYKRQGLVAEARAALRKITKPDANVLLQMGLLSLAENNLPQAEGELTRAFQTDPLSYEACYNLLLTQLTLGKIAECANVLGPRALELAASRPPDERRFLTTLLALLREDQKGGSSAGLPDPVLSELTAADEQRLLRVLRSLGQLDTALGLLKSLLAARPSSGPIREAYLEAVLVKGKNLIDRGHWTEADVLLRPHTRERAGSRAAQTALCNLMGCCACLTQDFDGALRYFQQAAKLAPGDARLQQNLALTYELQGDLAQADPHWNRYFDLLGDRAPAPADIPGYADRLAYEGLLRLSGRYSEKEKWGGALGYMQRACQLRPSDPEALERLFTLYSQAKRPGDARKTLDQLRKIRPGEPQYDLYELDLIEVKGLNDIEKWLTEIIRIKARYPGDTRVEERAQGMVNNVVPMIRGLCDQLTDQLSKVVDQVRHLPNYQINWTAVREVMRDLLRDFQKLRRLAGKCQTLVTGDDQKRTLRDLMDHIDKKMDACRSMGA